MIVVATAVAGVVLLRLAVVALLRVDQYPTRRLSWCPRCVHRWSGLDKLCPQCLARGLDDDGSVSPRPVHGHDFCGYMDTAPIPVVRGGAR